MGHAASAEMEVLESVAIVRVDLQLEKRLRLCHPHLSVVVRGGLCYREGEERESFSVSDLCPKELLNRILTRLSGATSVQSSADAQVPVESLACRIRRFRTGRKG